MQRKINLNKEALSNISKLKDMLREIGITDEKFLSATKVNGHQSLKLPDSNITFVLIAIPKVEVAQVADEVEHTRSLISNGVSLIVMVRKPKCVETEVDVQPDLVT